MYMQNSTPNFPKPWSSSNKSAVKTSASHSQNPSRLSGLNKKSKHRTEVSAGGLVLRRTVTGLDFAMVMDSYGKWAFPKGHVKPGEKFRDAAIREIHEELGLDQINFISRLGSIDIWFKDKYHFRGQIIHKYIHYFLFETAVDSELIIPVGIEGGETIRGVAWVPANELLRRSSYKDMIGIIKKGLRLCSSLS